MNDEPRYRLELLNERHSIEVFACEGDEFSDYLREHALQDIGHGFALTFVEIDRACDVPDNIAGFFTLRAHAERIKDEDGGADIEVPLIELMYLARDLRWRGQRIGDLLIIDVLDLVATASTCIGFIGLHLRSTGNGRALYERNNFQLFTQHRHFDGMRYILPVSFIREVAAALK